MTRIVYMKCKRNHSEDIKLKLTRMAGKLKGLSCKYYSDIGAYSCSAPAGTGQKGLRETIYYFLSSEKKGA